MASSFRLLISASALAAMFHSSQVLAQAADQSNPASPAAEDNQASPARSAQGDASETGNDIVVTAQRRQERLIDVPMSVTALSGADLDRSATFKTQDLTAVVPGLLWGRSTINAQPTIRGIGSRNAAPGDEPNVASFIDGVYQPDQSGLLQEFANVERVEVLKGPQGTLFGRNATGGAINIVTRKPSFTPTGSLNATYGSFNYRKVSGFISGPLVDKVLAASVSALAYGDDGYIDNIRINQRQGVAKGFGARGKLMLDVPGWNVALNASYVDSRSNIAASARPRLGNSQARTSANPTGIPLDILIPSGDFQTSTPFVPVQKSRQSLIDLHLEHDFGFATLSALAARGWSRANADQLSDVSPLALSRVTYALTDKYYNEEVVLTGRPGQIEWILGVDGFQADATMPLVTTTPAAVSIQTQSVSTRAVAGFAELTWRPVDKLSLTGGLRYSWDSKEASLYFPATNQTTGSKRDWSRLSPRAVVRYEFAKDVNVYASYTSGYKTGAYAPSTVAGAQTPAEPETVDAFELGFKSRIGAMATVNAAAFQYDYKDLQTPAFIIINGITSSVLFNAPSARVRGLELSGDFTPDTRLRLYWSASLLNTRIGDFPNANVQDYRRVNGIPTLGGNISIITNVAGKHLIRAPKSTFTLGGSYAVPVGAGSVVLDIHAFFSDKYYHDLLNRVEQPAYEVVNATVTWAINQNFRLSAFGQNLTNSRYASAALITGFTDAEALDKPRWYGVTAGFKF